ncbi:hypothetical protein ACVDG3_05365 [Meridianimarinicoccus sp. RP-17]|uniref:hypothetical protein n=1 Tax=Meridianimarinicoccus zhengii TaxID=2056810 RepID=UPI0013A688FE|nr:hypothetical protein [Phycocomes zhengii]
MSTTKDDTGTELESKAEDLKARLMRPLTVTAPVYAFAAAGIAVLALILVAMD